MNKKFKEEIKEEIERLKEEIEVLKFKVENPLGFKVSYYPFGGSYDLIFIGNGGKLKQINLSNGGWNNYYPCYNIVKDKKGNALIKETKIEANIKTEIFYRFDIEREILIQIKEEKNANE